MKTYEKPLSQIKDAKFLKEFGASNDVKVSIKIVDGQMVIGIRKLRFATISRALIFLRHIVEIEIVTVRDPEAYL